MHKICYFKRPYLIIIIFQWSNTLGVAQKWLGGPIIDDGTNYHATLYFTEPSKICNGTKRDKNYIGDKMFILMGKSQLMSIPLKEDKMANTKWVKGRCFYGMGTNFSFTINTYFREYFIPSTCTLFHNLEKEVEMLFGYLKLR